MLAFAAQTRSPIPGRSGPVLFRRKRCCAVSVGAWLCPAAPSRGPSPPEPIGMAVADPEGRHGISGGDFGCGRPVSGWDRWDTSPKDIPADGPLVAQPLSKRGWWMDWFGPLWVGVLIPNSWRAGGHTGAAQSHTVGSDRARSKSGHSISGGSFPESPGSSLRLPSCTVFPF